jgi:hypothetical protein
MMLNGINHLLPQRCDGLRGELPVSVVEEVLTAQNMRLQATPQVGDPIYSMDSCGKSQHLHHISTTKDHYFYGRIVHF